MLKNPGLFIVFEGIDGSGKSTISSLTAEYLTSIGRDTVKLSEPTSGKYGAEIRNILASSSLPDTEMMVALFILDREEDVKINIIPALESGKTIVMDRYFYSNAAYQGTMGGGWEKILLKNIEKKFPEPDRVYLIDIDPETAIKRISSRNRGTEMDIFEKTDFLGKTRKNYLEMADSNFMIINGNNTPESIMQKIKNDLKVLLK